MRVPSLRRSFKQSLPKFSRKSTAINISYDLIIFAIKFPITARGCSSLRKFIRIQHLLNLHLLALL